MPWALIAWSVLPPLLLLLLLLLLRMLLPPPLRIFSSPLPTVGVIFEGGPRVLQPDTERARRRANADMLRAVRKVVLLEALISRMATARSEDPLKALTSPTMTPLAPPKDATSLLPARTASAMEAEVFLSALPAPLMVVSASKCRRRCRR
jgi:hypothetical protein